MPSGKDASKIWAIATAQAKQAGYVNFQKGSLGHAVASRIAEAINKSNKK